MPWGVFKAADDDGDKGAAADEVNLKRDLGKISKLGGIKDPDKRAAEAKGLLASVDKIVERGKARQQANDNRRNKGK